MVGELAGFCVVALRAVACFPVGSWEFWALLVLFPLLFGILGAVIVSSLYQLLGISGAGVAVLWIWWRYGKEARNDALR